MSTTTTDRLPLRIPDVTVEHRDDGHVLRRPGRNTAHLLNETALALWQLCDGATTPEEMAEAVAELFGLDRATARHEVRRTLEELTEVGLVTWRGADGPGEIAGDRVDRDGRAGEDDPDAGSGPDHRNEP